jgi:hypothetical protein
MFIDGLKRDAQELSSAPIKSQTEEERGTRSALQLPIRGANSYLNGNLGRLRDFMRSML